MHQTTVYLNVDKFDLETLRMGLTSEYAIAKHLNLHASTVNRARKGFPIGQRFVIACTTYLPVTFEQITKIERAA